jgi:hypothetical protein
MVLRGRLDDGQLDGAEQPILVINQGEGDVDTLLHRGLREPFRHALSVRFVGQLLPECRQIVLAVGILDVREELGAFTCQMYAAPQQVAGGPHRRGIDLGLGEHPAAE